jgi:sugar-specific transcriptional regulator TrmB
MQKELLTKLDLTGYEARIMQALAKIGPSTVRSIVKQSHVPKNKAYEALQKLHEKNLVAVMPTTPRQYRLDNLKKMRELLSKKRQELTLVQRELEQIEKQATYPIAQHQEFFWVVKGQKAIQERLRLQNETVSNEILTVNKLSKYLPMNLRAMKECVKRGVTVHMICIVDAKNYQNVLRWKSTGAQIRVYNAKLFGNSFPRFSVLDSQKVRLTIGEPEVSRSEDYVSLWTENKGLAILFRNYFFSLWNNALPLDKELKKYKHSPKTF